MSGAKEGYCACPLHSTPPVKWKSKLLSRVWLFGIPWTVACQALLSGIHQSRILEWIVISFSRGPSQPRNRTQVSHIAGIFFIIWVREAPRHHQREGQTTWAIPPAWTLDTPLPSPHLRNEFHSLSGWVSKGIPCLFLLPPAAAGAPVKPCLNFLSSF